MKSELRLPELGEGITSGEVLAVLVSPGERIAAGQPVIEVGTDKAALEVPAEQGGVVDEVLVSLGDTIGAGTPDTIAAMLDAVLTAAPAGGAPVGVAAPETRGAGTVSCPRCGT